MAQSILCKKSFGLDTVINHQKPSKRVHVCLLIVLSSAFILLIPNQISKGVMIDGT